MTRAEAENAFALGLVRDDDRRDAGQRSDDGARITPEVLWEMKMADLKKSGLLEMYRGGVAILFELALGLSAWKQCQSDALGAAVQSVQRQPAPDRGLRDRACTA